MRKLIIFAVLIFVSLGVYAQDKTLRVDYIFSGTAKSQAISLDEMSCYDGWAGRRVNLDTVPVRGNGQIALTDAESGKVLYRQSFSTLFQEWQSTEEATRISKAFENVFLLPMPAQKAYVYIELYDVKGNVASSHRHHSSTRRPDRQSCDRIRARPLV